MIVKVQVPIYPPDGKDCLVYNEDRTVEYHGPIPDVVLKALGSRKKGFFYAKVKGDELVIIKEAPWQEW